MKWLLQRILAGLAALLLVAFGAGVLLRSQFTGEEAAWAHSTGHDAAWLGNAWVNGDRSASDLTALLPRLREGGFRELYVHVGELDASGELDPARYARAGRFLDLLDREVPETSVLGWISHHAEGSSLTTDRFGEEERAAIVASAGEVVEAGFAGVHYEITPVTTHDPTLPELLRRTREELGEDATVSVVSQHVEPIPGLRLPVLLASGGERFWSRGYVERVAEHADTIVIPGRGTGMPLESLYGGYMTRQTELALRTVSEETTVRIGVPAFRHSGWGDPSPAETVEAATRALRLGVSEVGERRDTVGVAVYVLDDAGAADWAAYQRGWLDRDG